MPPMRELHSWLRHREPHLLRLLKSFVEIESPTHDKAAVDRFARVIATEWKDRGARVHLLPNRERGSHVRAEVAFSGASTARQILVLGHSDTVYPIGTLAQMPFRIASGRACGPGTFDMKGGHVIALAAIDALLALRISPRRKIVFLWTSDEEVGSQTSRHLIESEARKSEAVFVLEPSFGPEGRLKTQRKGVGEAELIVTGRSAHAGIAPETGVNAVHEMALQIARLLKFNDPKRGITVQANVIEGGTATNVVAASARSLVDVRAMHASDARRLNRKLRALRPILPGAKLKVIGGINRPPMERTAGSAALFKQAQKLAREIGLSLGEASTGGGSDGNFTAALEIPTLDGLGVVGDGAHSPSEHIRISSLSERAALLAGLLASI